MVRRISVENLADGAHGLVLECVSDRLQHRARCIRAARDAIDSETERAEQPGPNRSFMIAAVTLADVAAIAGTVSWTAGRQRAQAERREKMTPARTHNCRLVVRGEGAVRQADGKDLVRPDGRIIPILTIDDVVQTRAVGLHETCEAVLCRVCQGAKIVRLVQ